MTRMPLEGIRVADFGWRAVAPISARMLAWGGAEGSFNVSHFFNNKNTNKLSVSLNLAHPRGKALALAIAAKSDIVVENFAGGVMARLGLGYEAIRELRPDGRRHGGHERPFGLSGRGADRTRAGLYRLHRQSAPFCLCSPRGAALP